MSPLTAADPLWLRLWAWRNRGITVPFLPPVPECVGDPWPSAHSAALPLPSIPSNLAGPWHRAPGGSRSTVVFLSEYRVLRVVRPGVPEAQLAGEIAALRAGGTLLPRLLTTGPGWLCMERLAGQHPSMSGPWVDELGAFAAQYRQTTAAGVPDRPEPEWSALDAALSPRVTTRLRTAIRTTDVRGAVGLSHGDLHGRNVLLDEQGRLQAVLDFEQVMLAPPEREVACWITLLAGQFGITAVQRATAVLCPDGVDGAVLHGEILRQLATAASSALNRVEPAAYLRTIRLLAELLIDDPSLPMVLCGA